MTELTITIQTNSPDQMAKLMTLLNKIKHLVDSNQTATIPIYVDGASDTLKIDYSHQHPNNTDEHYRFVPFLPSDTQFAKEVTVKNLKTEEHIID